jgi:hypothetical protein
MASGRWYKLCLCMTAFMLAGCSGPSRPPLMPQGIGAGSPGRTESSATGEVVPSTLSVATPTARDGAADPPSATLLPGPPDTDTPTSTATNLTLASATPQFTVTLDPTATPVPLSATAAPPTETSVPPSATSIAPTNTSVPPSATPRPPTSTPHPPTPTSTPRPPTPTSTPRPPTPTPTVRPACDPSYPDFCIPPPPPDLNCKDVLPHKAFKVLPPDPHHFDADHNGIGCET